MGWSVFARLTSFGLALNLALPLASLPIADAAADNTTTIAGSTKAPAGDNSVDNQGSDDGDSGVNDDPVWGYFLGKTAYVFFHEIAGAMKTPDGGTAIANTAAKRDQLAGLLLIAESGKRFGGAVLGDAVMGWILSWRQDMQDEPTADAKSGGSWDSRNLSSAQMSDLLCALYGSDPAHFHGLVDSGDIKADATAGCVEGYRKLTAQWTTLLGHAGIKLDMSDSLAAVDAKQGGSNSGQSSDADAATAASAISLELRPSTAPTLADFTGWLSDVGLANNLIAEANRDLTLAAPIKLVMLQCDKNSDPATASALPDGQTMLCYEWLKSGYDAATAQNVEAPPE
ncbi:MAG TPA: DUF4344 domain-containing metallopeptidase [Terriglobales bacterium]|nr:DUF4344 domain-containing metallopeptidase [Terriglobales bacterium]